MSMSNKIIEVKNVEINEYCLLNTVTGEKRFLKKSTTSGFEGSYFKENNTFFAIYPTKDGPYIFYKNKNYPISPGLTIVLEVRGKNRTFKIIEYNIEIHYIESKFMGFDVWSEEIDIDLFYMITQSYKDNSFYTKFTL